MDKIMPFRQRLAVARTTCQKISFALTDQIEGYVKGLDLDAQITPSIIRKMTIEFLGKPPSDIEHRTGWREFMVR